MGVRGLAVALVLTGHAALAYDFARFSGTFGVPDLPEETCATNPVFSTFSPDGTRVTFAWADPVPSYTGALITSYGGTIVATALDSLTMRRDGETRLDANGAKVLWIMRATTAPEGYCWTRPDWSPEDCILVVRCGPQPNN